MINNDRIVPVQKVDLLTLYGAIFNIAQVEYSVLQPSDILGDFSVAESGGTYLASQPIQSLDFGDGVTAGTVYFIAGYDYSGFTLNGVAVEATGDVLPDGVTLYKAVLADGAVTVSAVSPVVSED